MDADNPTRKNCSCRKNYAITDDKPSSLVRVCSFHRARREYMDDDAYGFVNQVANEYEALLNLRDFVGMFLDDPRINALPQDMTASICRALYECLATENQDSSK